jgi:hypothetical protein
MTSKHIAVAAIAAIGLATASTGMAQMGSHSTPAQATHGLPPTGSVGDGMDHGISGGNRPGMDATRSGHGQGDAMAMGGLHSMHRHCKTLWHHHHKVRRCM